MPILQDYEGNIFSGSANVNTSYRYFKEGYHLLKSGQANIIVPATEELVNRAIMVKLYSGSSQVKLYWGVKNAHPKILNFSQTYIDSFDGGNALIAESEEEAILEILIRQNTEIDYTIGTEGEEELMINPQVRTEGDKFFDIHTFYPGRELSFDVTINEGLVPQLPYADIAVIIYDFPSQYFLESGELVFLRESISVGSLNFTTGGSFNFTPDFTRHIGAFVSLYTDSNDYTYRRDWLFTYSPNESNTGGTFNIYDYLEA